MYQSLIGVSSKWRAESILSLPTRWWKTSSPVEFSCSCKNMLCSTSKSFLPFLETPKWRLLIKWFFSLLSAQLSFENVSSWLVNPIVLSMLLPAFLIHKRQKLLTNQSNIDVTIGRGISEHEHGLLVQISPLLSSPVFGIRAQVKDAWMQTKYERMGTVVVWVRCHP